MLTCSSGSSNRTQSLPNLAFAQRQLFTPSSVSVCGTVVLHYLDRYNIRRAGKYS